MFRQPMMALAQSGWFVMHTQRLRRTGQHRGLAGMPEPAHQPGGSKPCCCIFLRKVLRFKPNTTAARV